MPTDEEEESIDEENEGIPRLVIRKNVIAYLKSLGMVRIDKKLFRVLDMRVAELLKQAVWRVKEKKRRGIMYYDI